MRIGINAQLCTGSASYRNAGISQYIRQLVSAMGGIEDAPEIHLFLPGTNRDEFPAALALHRNSLTTERAAVRIAWEQVVLPRLVRRLGLDILHSPAYVLPAMCPAPSVVTVLDLAFIRYPETFPRVQREYLTFFTRRAVEKADAVIAISESTRRDVIEIFGVSPDKVVTTLLGVDDVFTPAPEGMVSEVRQRYGIGDMSVLYVGTIEPRKNVACLLAAFAEVRKRLGDKCELVLAGGKGWACESVFDSARKLGITDSVRFTGYVPRELLPALYSAAAVFVYPSLYEGFGLPPLEAMSCGAPVITSNTSSLPEVVGDAGIMVDPHDTSGLADALTRVLSDRNLREEMTSKSLAQARRFSWKETARQTLKLYGDVYCKARG